MSENNDGDSYIDIEESRRVTDEKLKAIIEEQYKISAIMIQKEERENMRRILKEILKIEGVSTRQLSRVTGISTNIIWHL